MIAAVTGRRENSAWRRIVVLSRGQLWRTRKIGSLRALLFASLGGFAIVALGVLARFAPGALTPATRRGLELATHDWFSHVDGGAEALALSLVWIQGPALLVLFSSMPVSNFASSLSSAEVSEGKAEYLLAAGWQPSEIAFATSATVAWRSMAIYLTMASAWFAGGVVLSSVLGVRLGALPWTDLGVFVGCGVVLTLWTATIVSLSSVRWPAVNALRLGTSSAIGTLGAAPGLIVLALMTFVGGDDLTRLVVTVAIAALLLMCGTVLWLACGIDRGALLS